MVVSSIFFLQIFDDFLVVVFLISHIFVYGVNKTFEIFLVGIIDVEGEELVIGGQLLANLNELVIMANYS